ncbi:MAG TPA: DnaJ domain-containing protein [Kofleriaceae bacterium]|nr:DnaJ domain-containing protein [Kofleriaceae bacterium]
MAGLDFDPSVDHYKVLGVSKEATADEIKKAYRKLAKANHPDSTGGDKAKEHRFKEISNAYDVLGDEKKREQYDAIRAGGFRGGNPFSGFGGAAGGAPGGGQVWDLGDLFGQFFGGGGPGGAGRGGRVRVERFDFGDDDGDVFVGGRRGRRREHAPEEPEPKVKASDGTWLTVKDGDVHSELRIPFDRAILGTVADIATIDGTAKVKVPPGTSSGKKLRLRGKGVQRGNVSGDHYVTVHIDVPADLDEDAKKALVELTHKLSKKAKRA